MEPPALRRAALLVRCRVVGNRLGITQQLDGHVVGLLKEPLEVLDLLAQLGPLRLPLRVESSQAAHLFFQFVGIAPRESALYFCFDGLYG